MIFIGFAALIPAGIIAYLALSKKTSPAVKKVSVIALVIITLSFIACTIILVIMLGSSAGNSRGFIDLPVMPAQETKRDIFPVIVASAAVLFFLILVIVLALREQRKKS